MCAQVEPICIPMNGGEYAIISSSRYWQTVTQQSINYPLYMEDLELRPAHTLIHTPCSLPSALATEKMCNMPSLQVYSASGKLYTYFNLEVLCFESPVKLLFPFLLEFLSF